MDSLLENFADSYLCFQLALLYSVSYIFFLYRSSSLLLCTLFNSISSSTDEVLLINPYADVFVLGNFNTYQKNWLTYSGETHKLVNSVIIFLSQTTLLRQLTFILRSMTDSHSPALLDLFLSSEASICSTMTFPPLGKSDHVVVSVSIEFPINSKQDVPFHCAACDYSHADWDGLCDHLRDVTWEDIFKVSASAAASEFCNWV